MLQDKHNQSIFVNTNQQQPVVAHISFLCLSKVMKIDIRGLHGLNKYGKNRT